MLGILYVYGMVQDMIKKTGFTLIELLIVIAIIGILSAMVLASLGSARDKSRDAKIQAQMKSLQSSTALYYSINGKYGVDANCGGMTTDSASGADKLFATSPWPDNTAPVCKATLSGSNYTSFWAYHVYASSASKFWCVDSSGTSKEVGGVPAGPTC